MKRLFLFYWMLTLSILFSSCSEDEILRPIFSSDFIVQYDEAKEFAKIYFQDNQKNQLSLRTNWEGDSRTFKGENNIPGLHVFNYQNGDNNSFIIISGDNRIAPILAYGNEDFPLDYIPYGVADWMKQQIQFIDSIRTTNLVQTNVIGDIWQARILPKDDESGCCQECPNYPECLQDPLIGCGTNSDVICDGITDDNPCGNNNYFQYGPLLDTRWGQGCVYNEDCPSNTGTDCNCDHAATGCVATAMAQVVNYFEHPSSYDYSIFQERYRSWDFGLSGANEIAELMYDCGISVDMSYGCSSDAQTGDVNEAFEDDFNYSYGGTFNNYGSSEQIKQNIRNGKPVIFAGCDGGISIFDWVYNDCHAWVCDGYKGFSNRCHTYLYYDMNWGWNGSHNGWYGVSNWAPGSFNFQYRKRVLFNINP